MYSGLKRRKITSEIKKKIFVLRYGGKFKNYFRKIPKSITLSKLAPISNMNTQFDWKLNEDFENHHVLYF